MNKEFKQALKDALVPYLVGMRNELRSVFETLKKIESAPTPDILKTQEVNPQKEIAVTNFPDKFTVVLENRTVAVEGLSEALSKNATQVADAIDSEKKQIAKGFASNEKVIHTHFVDLTKMVKALSGILSKTLSVKVENQVKLPDVQKVEITNHQKAVKDTFISNRTPSEAIPVRLVDKKGKAFYQALLNAVSDVDLSKTNKLLTEIRDSQGDITINAGDINLNTDELENLLGKDVVCFGGSPQVYDNTSGWVLPWGSYVVPAGKKLLLKEWRATAMGDGHFALQINGANEFATFYPSWTTRGTEMAIEQYVQAGDSVDIYLMSYAITPSNYNSSFSGYLMPA